MLPAEVLQQIRALELKAGHLVTDALAGNYLSVFKGRGMEFDEVREYVAGDDVRSIDWNVTARMGSPYIKVLREERELTLMLLVDVSPSQGFGSVGRLKQELAAEMAAVLAFLAIRNHDKVGLLVFSDHVEQFIAPRKGRGHVWSIIRSVLTHRPQGKKTDLSGALETMLRSVKQRCMCFVISDFWVDDYHSALQRASRRHDMVMVRVADPQERELAGAGMVAFQDSETGELIELDTSNASVRAAYGEAAKAREKSLTTSHRRLGIGGMTISTTGSVTGPLLRFLKERERRRTR